MHCCILPTSSHANLVTLRHIFISGVVMYASYSLFERLVLGPVDKLEEGDLPETTEEEDLDWFIPFPGTTKELKPQPYRGTDPEWQEFVKFSKDRPLQDKVRGLLLLSSDCRFANVRQTSSPNMSGNLRNSTPSSKPIKLAKT